MSFVRISKYDVGGGAGFFSCRTCSNTYRFPLMTIDYVVSYARVFSAHCDSFGFRFISLFCYKETLQSCADIAQSVAVQY